MDSNLVCFLLATGALVGWIYAVYQGIDGTLGMAVMGFLGIVIGKLYVEHKHSRKGR